MRPSQHPPSTSPSSLLSASRIIGFLSRKLGRQHDIGDASSSSVRPVEVTHKRFSHSTGNIVDVTLPSLNHAFKHRRRSAVLSRIRKSFDSGRGRDASVSFDFVKELPLPLVRNILSYLDIPTLNRLCAVSRAWYQASRDENVWCLRYFSLPGYRIRLPQDPIRSHLPGVPAPPPTKPPPVQKGVQGFPGYRQLCLTRREMERRWRTGDLKSRFLEGHLDAVYCVQFDREKIVTGSRDSTVKIWHPESGRCLTTLYAHTASVLCLRYDDTYLVTGSSDHTACVWTFPLFEQKWQFTQHGGGVLDVCFDHDYVVTCSKDTMVKVWNIRTGELVHTLVKHRGPVNAVQMHSGRIVSASGDSTLKVWNLESGMLVRELLGHSRGLACVRFDGKTVVSGSNDQSIKVWDVETGLCLWTLTGHTNLVRALWFDDKWIVSGSYDQTVKVWCRETGRVVLDLKNGHHSWVFDVHFDTTKIISTSQDNRIVIWDFGYGLDTTYIG